MAALSPGANVRLLGSVIECAAGALPDKSHANAVEAPRVDSELGAPTVKNLIFFVRFHVTSSVSS